ncbi:MAG TPA: DNRLRE domain-containing protein, partial [Candidatus Coatesbacteria bacterium]|nr:DNRLRE domain-containing protein [Candidatus Coatesbacteria bacterium]
MNRLFFACLAVLVAASVASALEWVFLTTDADSYVRYAYEGDDEGHVFDEKYADDNYGGAQRLYVKRSLYKSSDIKIAYLHFNFHLLDDYGYVGADLVEARLVFYAEEAAEKEKYVHVLGDPWDEMTVTYNTRPRLGERVATFDYMDAGYNYIDLDVGPIALFVDMPET